MAGKLTSNKVNENKKVSQRPTTSNCIRKRDKDPHLVQFHDIAQKVGVRALLLCVPPLKMDKNVEAATLLDKGLV